MLNASLYSSNKDDWETPQALYDSLNEEFHFSLDPCCQIETAKCPNFFTPLDDGLGQKWYGTVFMNPPYGRGIAKWVEKAKNESWSNSITVVCLLPARTDTRWWHDHCMEAAEIRLCNRRLSFEGSNNKATFPAAIVIFKPDRCTPSLGVQKV